ncbi:MAG TPA: hypothetical protein VN694_14665 [Caulobacteraceae bacterium]|nr:hypothetical protein [Caulobacteraceae bacterium]
MRRAIAILLAVTMGGNGLVMLAAGRWWYGAVAGVPETGPFNPHFVKDIGAAYLVVGAAFAWLAARPAPEARGAAMAAAAFLALHAGIHLAEAVGAPAGLADLARDFPGVILPALLAVWTVAAPYQSREPRHAQSPA